FRVVARLAIDREPLPAALEKRLVNGDRGLRDELPVRALAGEEGRVLLQPADRYGAWNGQPHRRSVVEKRAGRLGAHLRLVVHARIEVDGRTARRAAARASRQPDERRERESPEHGP